MKNKFFGSKLNSILLLVLIILMVIATGIMKKNRADYFGALGIKDKTAQIDNKEQSFNSINDVDGGMRATDSWKIFDNQKIWPVKFKYPSDWKIISKHMELSPGKEGFEMYCITKTDCDSLDAIFLGDPYIGVENPVNYYIIMKAVNNTGPYSIRWNASSEALNVFRLLVGTSGY